MRIESAVISPTAIGLWWTGAELGLPMGRALAATIGEKLAPQEPDHRRASFSDANLTRAINLLANSSPDSRERSYKAAQIIRSLCLRLSRLATSSHADNHTLIQAACCGPTKSNNEKTKPSKNVIPIVIQIRVKGAERIIKQSGTYRSLPSVVAAEDPAPPLRMRWTSRPGC